MSERLVLGVDWFLNEMTASREAPEQPLSVILKYCRDDETHFIEMIGVRDYLSLDSLLEADRIQIKENEGSYLEYGRFTFECYGETYSEYYADDIRISYDA